jgi:S1-C subfamily serine protease
MVKALRGFVAFTLLVVGLSSHSSLTEWTQVSAQHHPEVTINVPPSVHKGASDKRMPNLPPDGIRKITCDRGWGTGVVISEDTMMTADHVIAGQTGCHDDETGETFEVVYKNASQDFAILRYTKTKHKHWLKVSCDGFTDTGTYYALGYAGVGTGDLSMFRLRATNEVAPEGSKDQRSGTDFTGTRVLDGTVIPGMSGGPIVDIRGRVVGINNATANNFRMALSREVKTTLLCLNLPVRPK